MGNRAMDARRARAAKQSRENAIAESLKPDNVTASLNKSALREEARALIAAFDGQIVKCKAGNAHGLYYSIGRQGRAGARAWRSCGGDGRRVAMGVGTIITGD